jgi:hypothetical protein
MSGGADPRAVREQTMLALAMAGLLAVVAALSTVGAGTVARALFMLAALVFAVLTRRRSPWLYLTATLWFWLTTSFVRRIGEWHGGFNATDIVLATPSLMAMPILSDMLRTPGLLKRPGIGYAMLPFACVAYGMFVSFVGGDLLAGCFAAIDWLVPLLYLFLFICHAERIDEAQAHLSTFLGLGMIFLVPYSLYQYFLMPDWDAQWMIQSGMGSVGHPLPMDSHVFGPLNNPGYLAVWLGTCLVLASHFRSRLLVLATPFLFLLLAITMVRSVWGSVLLAMLAGALAGRGGFGRLLLIVLLAGASLYGGLAVLSPRVTDQIALRFASMQNLDSDDSAGVRAQIYAETPKLIDDNPFGVGIGAQGRGKAADAGRGAVNTINIDSGPLSVFLALGWVAGPLYILGMGLLQYRALGIGRARNSPVAAAMAGAAIVPLAMFPFINILGFSAMVLWMCLGYALAVDIRATMMVDTRATRATQPAAPRARLLPQ